MRHVLRITVQALGLALAFAPAAAQQRPATPAPAATAKPPGTPAQPSAPAQTVQGQPPAGSPAGSPPAAPPPPQPVRTEIIPFDNWTVTCREFADKRRLCSAVLQVVQQQNSQVVFVWVLGRNGDGKLMSVLQTPTGVTLAPGVDVKLARGANRKATYVNCEASRCEATLDLDDAFIRDATASETVEATLFGTNGQGAKFALPFKGFDKAVAAVR